MRDWSNCEWLEKIPHVTETIGNTVNVVVLKEKVVAPGAVPPEEFVPVERVRLYRFTRVFLVGNDPEEVFTIGGWSEEPPWMA